MIISDYNQIKVFIYNPGVKGETETYLEYDQMATENEIEKCMMVQDIESASKLCFLSMIRNAQNGHKESMEYYQGMLVAYMDAINLISAGSLYSCDTLGALMNECSRSLVV